jgi:hypothetical protein
LGRLILLLLDLGGCLNGWRLICTEIAWVCDTHKGRRWLKPRKTTLQIKGVYDATTYALKNAAYPCPELVDP